MIIKVSSDPADAKSLGGTGRAVGQPGGAGGPAMEKRNIFSLFRVWIRCQGGQVRQHKVDRNYPPTFHYGIISVEVNASQAALMDLVQEIDKGGGAVGGEGGPGGKGKNGTLDVYEVQQLLKKVRMLNILSNLRYKLRLSFYIFHPLLSFFCMLFVQR